MSSTTSWYYILREGSTNEEQWTWDEITNRCRTGEFTPDTRVFFPDEGKWLRAEDTDLSVEFEGLSEGDDGLSADEREAREALDHEYSELMARLEDDSNSVEPWIDAGCLASDMDNLDASREHFQKALELKPFHPRVTQEVKRRFPRADWRRFRLLERPVPVWDNLGDVISFPMQRGWLYLVFPAAVFSLLLFVRGGGLVVAALALLWCYQTLKFVASGNTEPPTWRRAVVTPVSGIIVPGAALGAVFAQWLVIFWLFARAGMLLERKADVAVFSYLGSSPILMIALTVCALAYLPAVMIMVQPSLRPILRVLNPWSVVRGVLKMRGEYAMSLLLLFSIALALGVLGAVTGGLPIAGKVVWACAVTFCTTMAAIILGRLQARVSHLL